MSNYDFSNINDKELEELSRELLSREMRLEFQSFGKGRDSGIDLRYSTPKSNNCIVVQCKHYWRSGYSALKSNLLKEKNKVELLKPMRYIIVTSIALTPANKDEIKKNFTPYIQNTSDIFGQDDLNRLISKYPDIERNNFKLWLQSTNILCKILHNAVSGRSSFTEDSIRKNINLYVKTKDYDIALDILRKNKILLITGTPGIGKTTLAKLLIYYMLSQDFQLVTILNDVKEGEDMFNEDPSVRQVFYFDDFLGTNYLDIIHGNRGKAIVEFIERVRMTKNKYFILTTRSTILNQARGKNEDVERSGVCQEKYELSLNNYSAYDKALILYNHLYFSDLPNDILEVLFKDKNYWKVISHPNYTPRIIEFFTKKRNLQDVTCASFLSFVLNKLKTPSLIWKSAIENQLSKEDRFLLMTLFSFPRSSAWLEDLQNAFEARLEYEARENNYSIGDNVFEISFSDLLDGFISNMVCGEQLSYVSFINPSIKDFLLFYYNSNQVEKWKLIKSAYYIEQIVNMYSPKNGGLGNIVILSSEVSKFILIVDRLELHTCLSRLDTHNYISIELCNMYCDFIDKSNSAFITDVVCNRLKAIDYCNFSYINIDSFLHVLLSFIDDARILDFIKNNLNRVCHFIIMSVRSIKSFDEFKYFLKKLGINYDDYKKGDSEWLSLLHLAVERTYHNESDDFVHDKMHTIFSDQDIDDIVADLNNLFNEISSKMAPFSIVQCHYNPLDSIDLEKVKNENIVNDVDMEAFTHEDWRRIDFASEREMIDDLFSYYNIDCQS